jgi:hypothetical protein
MDSKTLQTFLPKRINSKSDYNDYDDQKEYRHASKRGYWFYDSERDGIPETDEYIYTPSAVELE